MAIAVILFLGLIFRLINLNQSLWLDEAVQAIISQGSLAGIFAELTGDFHPPFYHLLMWVWVRLFGSSGVVLRLPSVLFGVGTIWVVGKIGEVIRHQASVTRGQRSGISDQGSDKSQLPIAVALFMAIAPYHVYYSQEARMYAMTTFFACLSMYWFLRVGSEERGARSKTNNIDSRLYILSTVLMLYSDYYGFLVLLAQIISTLIIFKKQFISLYSRSEFKLRLYLYISISLLLFLPWLPFFITQLKTGFQATHDLPNWANLVNVGFVKALPLTFIKFAIGRITIFDKRLYALAALGILGVFGGIGVRGGMEIVRSQESGVRSQKNRSPVTVLLWLVIPILASWLVSLFIPNYQPFRLLLVLPAFYLLLAMGVVSIKSKRLKILVLFFILLTPISSLLAYYTNSYFHREDWRGVVEFIENQKEPSVAILPSATSNWPIRYYDPEGEIRLVAVGKGVGEVGESDLTNFQFPISNFQIFYIRYLVPLFDPQELISQKLRELGYVKIREVSFNQIPVWVYTKKI